MFCYLYIYLVKPGRQASFEAAYGADGPWVALFRRSPDYLGTELGRDVADARRYFTIDRWTSREACLGFRERMRGELDALDRECELLTESERPLGDFDLLV